MKSFLSSKALIILMSLFLALGMVAVPAGRLSADTDMISIDEINFPDPVFRDYVKNKFSTDKDYFLDDQEIKEAKVIDTEELGKYINVGTIEKISDLKGIEKLTSLEDLKCYAIDNEIDVSSNTALVSLGVYETQLSSLDLHANTKLKVLNVEGDNFKSLDVSNNTALDELYISGSSFENIDLSKNTGLFEFSCYNTGIKKLDLSKNTELVRLICEKNNFTELDVSNNKKLELLDCSSCGLTSLDLKQNTELSTLMCTDNKLNDLDLSKNEHLNVLHCSRNPMKKLDIRNCPNLVELYNSSETHEFGDIVYHIYDVDGIYRYLQYDKGIEVIYEDPATPTPTPTSTPAATPTATSTATPTPVVKIKLNKKNETIVCGKKLQLKATVTGTDKAVKWTSSNKKIATVTGKGLVIGKSAGSVTITASVAGKKATCKIQVLYKDVTKKADYWFKPTYELTKRGIVKGYNNQTYFRPNSSCTRAQMVTFLWRLAGEPEPKSAKCDFTDVSETEYYYKPVLWAVGKGITKGVSPTKFKPNGICTRAQTVTFLWRMAGKPKITAKKSPFKDVKPDDYFFKAVVWANKINIVAGYSGNTFKPNNKCTRKQMVTFLYKYSLKYKTK